MLYLAPVSLFIRAAVKGTHLATTSQTVRMHMSLQKWTDRFLGLLAPIASVVCLNLTLSNNNICVVQFEPSQHHQAALKLAVDVPFLQQV